MTTRREIVLINKNEGGPPSRLDKIEKVAKIVSVVALPLVVGIGGWWIQDALSRRDTDQDYVELAISILSKPQDETQTDLREWAASLLAETSPIEIPESLRERLGGGEVQLPSIPRSPEFAPVSELPESDPRSGLLGSIARFQVLTERGVGVCTSWLVSAYQLLTAAHCARPGGEDPDAAKALFGYVGSSATETAVFVDLQVPATEINPALDYAVFVPVEGASFNGFPLSVSQTGPQVGDRLFILHHPAGREMSFPVHPCRVLSLDGDRIIHNCDTIPGAGGAPLINADTLQVVGMHLGSEVGEVDAKYGVQMDVLVKGSELLQGLADP